MSRFKISIVTAVTAVAAFSAILAPVASGALGRPPIGSGIVTIAPTDGTSARPNDGRYQQSSEALRKSQENVCENYWTMFEHEVGEAKNAYDAGNKSSFLEHLKNATQTKNAAKSAGCGWAA